MLLTGLGVAYVVSGDYAGWNFGLAEGGFGGLAIGTVLMGLMYTCLVLSLAELSSILPTAGGGYGFARRALGTRGGFLTGTAILIGVHLWGIAMTHFTFHSRQRLVASAPEEEFAALAEAEAELERG